MALNSGDHPGEMVNLPGLGDFDPRSGTTAGSDGIRPDATYGADLGQVSHTAATNSLSAGMTESFMPGTAVYAGETTSTSDGIGAHTSSITGDVDQAKLNSQGQWHGNVGGPDHPNSMFGRSPGRS